MNQKIIIIALVVVLVSLSVKIIINETQTHEPFKIQTQDDLTKIKQDLYEEMVESRIFLERFDIYTLVSADPEIGLITFDPNIDGGLKTGGGTFPDGYTLTKDYPNGTRTFYQYDNNDTLRKSIVIHDEHEKSITIIFK